MVSICVYRTSGYDILQKVLSQIYVGLFKRRYMQQHIRISYGKSSLISSAITTSLRMTNSNISSFRQVQSEGAQYGQSHGDSCRCPSGASGDQGETGGYSTSMYNILFFGLDPIEKKEAELPHLNDIRLEHVVHYQPQVV